MGSDADDLEVDVEDISIIVTNPCTNFMVVYQKQSASPHLSLTYDWVGKEETSPAVSEFRARAFQAAVAKARELGWIA